MNFFLDFAFVRSSALGKYHAIDDRTELALAGSQVTVSANL